MLARVQASPVDSAELAETVREACVAELLALKPGNVSAHALSHPFGDASLTPYDFELSAQAIGQPLCEDASKPVGDRILDAIIATQEVVNTNTNLGIVLLLAPLTTAMQLRNAGQALREALGEVLAGLTLRDAQLTYEAIRLAQPGGMGQVQSQDISNTPTVTLLQAMALAAPQDTIAQAYLDQYETVFNIGLPALQSCKLPGLATTQCYLSLLAAQPDSLIQRKQGRDVAVAVMQRAQVLRELAKHVHTPSALDSFEHELSDWDEQLKAKKINPGTTADFTVACLFIDRVRDLQA
jgi:triphosphoribosyl-dephospho-CoA synthase